MKKFLSISCIVLVLDRIIKVLVQGLLSSDRLYIIKKFFYLVYVKNIGAAFSILEGKSILLILIGVGLVSYGIANIITSHDAITFEYAAKNILSRIIGF